MYMQRQRGVRCARLPQESPIDGPADPIAAALGVWEALGVMDAYARRRRLAQDISDSAHRLVNLDHGY